MARQLRWIPPAHTGLEPLVLNDRTAGFRVEKGSRGLGAVQRELITEDSPFAEGTSVEDDVALPRSIMLPMSLNATDRDAYLTLLRGLEAAVRTRAPGRRPAFGELELAQHDGRRFRVRCHYMGGLPDEETIDSGGDGNWVRFGLQLLAPDPYWYSAEPTILSWTYHDPVPFLGDPFLPLRISPSQQIGDATIINNGSESALGIWRVTGPGNDLILANQDTSETLRITETIPAGQVLTIVTQPELADIALQPSGTDWWEYLADDASLWEIPPGTTTASLTLTGAADGSRIELEFHERHGSPW